jgi:hypothetical protein
MMVDQGFVGIMSGLSASQNGSGDYTVNVSAGWGYDDLGERIAVASTQNVDLSVDYLSASTNVSTSGHSKVVSLCIEFARDNTTPVTDANGFSLDEELESFAFVVVQGSEAATGTQVPPAKPAHTLLICNVTLSYNSSLPQQITNGMIDMTSSGARDDLVVALGSPVAIRRGKYSDVVSDLVAALNDIAAGTTTIAWGPGPSWAGGSSPTNPATTVSGELTKIINDLSATTTGASGADRTGVAALVGASSTIVSGTLFAALTALKSADWIDLDALGAWADGTTNPAVTLQTGVARVVSDLASTSTSGRGAGAAKIGFYSTGTGYGSSNVQAALVALTSTVIDGGSIVGTATRGRFTANNVRGDLDTLDSTTGKIASATHVTGAWTFDNIATTTGNHYQQSSRSITRVQTEWMNVSSGSNPTGSSVILNVGASFAQKLLIPHGAEITSIVVHVAPGAHSSLPATLPTLTLWREDVTTGVGTNIGTVTDNGSLWISNNAAGYSTAHDLPITGLTETVDRTKYAYFASFGSESGANSTSITAYACRVVYTTTTIDDGY